MVLEFSWFIGLFLVWIMRYIGLVGPDGIWEKIIFGTSLQSKCTWVWVKLYKWYFFFKKRFSLTKLELSQKEKNVDRIWDKVEIFVKCLKFLLWLEKLIGFFVKERKSKLVIFFFWFPWCGEKGYSLEWKKRPFLIK